MWRDSEPQQGAASSTPASRRLSPMLQAFELNPLRLLRIAASATTSQAAFEAERVLTLARADMAPDRPDPLPWLPSPGFPELQQAAQSVEEPLIRLRFQLLWFDFDLDPGGNDLATALRTRDERAIAHYLEEGAAEPSADASDDGVPPVQDDAPAMARALNQANVRLLLAASVINDLWAGLQPGPRPAAPFPEGDWRASGGLRSFAQAHKAGPDAPAEIAEKIAAWWRGGLDRWMALLANARFRAFVVSRIEAIDDDFAQGDDAAVVLDSIREHLAELSAQEIRALLIENRYGLASGLVAALAGAGLDPRLLTPVMRPVRQLLQTELSTLDPLLERAEEDKGDLVAQYLRRLDIVRGSWLALDETGILGLADLIDQSVERIYLRLRQWEKPGPEVDTLLEHASAIASAQSLRERISTLRTQQQTRRQYVCHYCEENDPDPDRSVVLKGKKETHRTRSFNKTTIHYLTTQAYALRCARCASLHDYVRAVSIALTSFTLLAFAIVALLYVEAIPADPLPNPLTLNSNDALNENLIDSDSTGDAPVPPITDDSGNSADGQQSSTDASNLIDDSDFAMRKPVLGETTNLSTRELRWCLVTKIELDAEGAEMDRIKSNEVDRYNRNVDGINNLSRDYNSRCISREYFVDTKEKVQIDVEKRRDEIERKSKSLIR